MYKDLELQLGSLKAQNAELELSFHHKKLQYEKIIQQLQQDNEHLRKQLTSMSPASNGSPLSSSPHGSSKAPEYPLTLETPHVAPFQSPRVTSRVTELELQNSQLKKELSELTQTYQEQIQQLTTYFNLIKQSYPNRPSQTPQSGFLGLPPQEIVSIYDKMVLDFKGQKQKFIDKIQELIAYISALEQKGQASDQKQRQAELELSIAREELKIYKRGK